MSRKNNYDGREKKPLQVVLYIAAVLILLGCLAFYVYKSRSESQKYQDLVGELSAQEENDPNLYDSLEEETAKRSETETEQETEKETRTQKATEKKTASTQTKTTDKTEKESESETETENETENEALNKNILVLNGTRKPGVAAYWKEELESEGYTSVSTASYNAEVDESTVIYYADQESDAEALLKLFEGATAREGQPGQYVETESGQSLPDDIDIWIVVGKNDVHDQQS
jgi:cytoskeletal protein RodZ